MAVQGSSCACEARGAENSEAYSFCHVLRTTVKSFEICPSEVTICNGMSLFACFLGPSDAIFDQNSCGLSVDIV